MILPLHTTRSRAHGRGRRAPVQHRLPTIPCSRRFPSNRRRAARSATSPCRSPSSWRDACARRRAPSRRRSRPRSARSTGFSRIEAAPNGYVNFFLDRPHVRARGGCAATERDGRCRRACARRSSSTRPSTRTRRRTSATCATPRSATRSAGCSAFSAATSRSRTTSTTRASRSPTSPSGSASSNTRRSTTCGRSPTSTRFDYYCWDLYARVTEWYDEDKERLKIRTAALHQIEHGEQRHRRARPLHRRSHRPLPPEDDAADEHRLRPAHVGRRHPPPAFLDARVRVPEEDGRRVPADRGQAHGLLGDADRRRSAPRPTRTVRRPVRRSVGVSVRPRRSEARSSARKSSSVPTAR